MNESAVKESWRGGSGEHAPQLMAERVCAGLSYRQLRIFREAVDSLETTRRAREYEGALGTAREYLWRGQTDAALGEIAQALSLDLGREEAFILLGQTLEQKGRLDSARSAYCAVLQLAPLSDEARRGLARVEERLEAGIGIVDSTRAPAPAAEYGTENNRR
jgi:tetratricopeptide (TPR) repeat protein